MLERIEIVGEIDKTTFLRYICRGSFEFAKRRFFHSEEERKISRSKRANPTVKTKQQKMGRGENRIIYFIKYFFEKFISQLVYARTNSTNKLVPFRNYCFNNLAKLFFDRRRRRRRGRLESIQLLALFQKGREIGLIYYPSPLNLAS